MGRARVVGGFAAFGLCWGTWGAVLPAVQADTQVGNGELGAALLLIGAGALASMRIAGSVLDRAGRAGARSARVEPVARVRLRGVPRPLLVLGGLCALAFFVENAWQSWGAVYLSDDLAASPFVAALAPTLFAASAAGARFASHALLPRAGELALLRTGAIVGALGSVLASQAPGPATALAGVVATGAGISICAPILISLAGATSKAGARAAAVSIVTTIAYLGFVVSPAVVGLLAAAAGLRASLAAVAVPALALAALAAAGTTVSDESRASGRSA